MILTLCGSYAWDWVALDWVERCPAFRISLREGGREREPSSFRLAADPGSVAQVRIGLRILLAPSGLGGPGPGGAVRR